MRFYTPFAALFSAPSRQGIFIFLINLVIIYVVKPHDILKLAQLAESSICLSSCLLLLLSFELL